MLNCARTAACFAVFMLLAAPSFAEDLKDIHLPPTRTTLSADLKAPTAMIDASRLARTTEGFDLAAEKLHQLGRHVFDGEQVRVEVLADPELHGSVLGALWGHGGSVARVVRDRVEARVPLESLEGLALELPNGAIIEPVGFGQFALDTEGQGPTIMRDGPYRDLGFDGSGITIAIIDVGYQGLVNSRLTGDAPAASVDVNLSALPFEHADDGNHGRFVVETLYDHAPGASYRIYKVDTHAQAAQAIDLAAQADVHMISMSLGYFPAWEDGDSTIAQAADAAASQGILVFNSAGNHAQKHWQDDFSDPDGDNFLSWDGNDDEALRCIVDPDTSCTFTLIWDRSGGTHNYDLFIYNSDVSELLDSSVNGGESYESVTWKNTTNQVQIVQIAAQRISGPGTTLEMFGGRETVMDQHIDVHSSVLSPSDAFHPNVITVGAVEQSAYGSPKYQCCIQALYSSRGPTNGSQSCPDICAPTSTSGSFFSSFIGTSCSCPHAAGLTAVLWSTNPAGAASQVRDLMYEYAADKDWGVVLGQDSTYGRGGANLPELEDCNFNGFPDAFDIASGGSDDDNDNGRPDECDPSGFEFGVLMPELPPTLGFAMVATMDPSPSPTSPSPAVTGVDMVFGFDSNVLQIDNVLPAPELIEVIGDTPVEFDFMVVGDAVGVRCNFDFDPATGAPQAFPFSTSTEMLIIECSLVPGTGGTGGPPIVDFGIEDQTALIGLLLPAVQKVRAVDASGTAVELDPTFAAPMSFPTVELPRHGYRFVSGAGIAETFESEFFVEVDPSSPVTDFSLRWVAHQLFESTDLTTGLSAAIRIEFEDILVSSVTTAAATQALNPDFFTVAMGTDGVGIDMAWSSTLPGVQLSVTGLQIADVAMQTTATVFDGSPDGDTAMVRFATPDSLPTATNTVLGPGYVETPLLVESPVHLIPLSNTGPTFRRGDVNNDGVVSPLVDSLFLLGFGFSGGPTPPCFIQADISGDGEVSPLIDTLFLLSFGFSGGTPPPAPGVDCGVEALPSGLDCLSGTDCP